MRKAGDAELMGEARQARTRHLRAVTSRCASSAWRRGACCGCRSLMLRRRLGTGRSGCPFSSSVGAWSSGGGGGAITAPAWREGTQPGSEGLNACLGVESAAQAGRGGAP